MRKVLISAPVSFEYQKMSLKARHNKKYPRLPIPVQAERIAMAPLNNVARMNVGNRPELSQQEAPQLRDPGPADDQPTVVSRLIRVKWKHMLRKETGSTVKMSKISTMIMIGTWMIGDLLVKSPLELIAYLWNCLHLLHPISKKISDLLVILKSLRQAQIKLKQTVRPFFQLPFKKSLLFGWLTSRLSWATSMGT